MHSKKSVLDRCCNKEISAPILEARVDARIQAWMLDPTKLKDCMEYFKDSVRTARHALESQLKAIDQKIHDLENAKDRIIDIYVSGELDRDA